MPDDSTETPTIGHNQPPEPTPFELASQEVEKLYGEAKLWLDGEEVDRQEMADEISKLLNMIRAAKKTADTARKDEKKPFDDGAKEVQARYKPLLDKADLAADACKKALAPWLQKLQRESDELAERARQEAAEKARAAQEAIRNTQADNLAEREAAEALVKEAKDAETAANKASKATAKASGGVGRATSLRTTYTPVIIDPVLAASHYWKHAQKEIEELVLSLAKADVRAGVRNIPGIEIREEKIAV